MNITSWKFIVTKAQIYILLALMIYWLTDIKVYWFTSIKGFNSFVIKDNLNQHRKKKHEEYIPQELTKQLETPPILPTTQPDIPNPTNKTNNLIQC